MKIEVKYEQGWGLEQLVRVTTLDDTILLKWIPF